MCVCVFDCFNVQGESEKSSPLRFFAIYQKRLEILV